MGEKANNTEETEKEITSVNAELNKYPPLEIP